MAFSEKMPERHSRAYLAYLASGKARHVKATNKALKNNAIRLEFPKLGERAYFSSLFFRLRVEQDSNLCLKP